MVVGWGKGRCRGRGSMVGERNGGGGRAGDKQADGDRR